MKFKDGKTFSAYVRSKLHSGYITINLECTTLYQRHKYICQTVSVIEAYQTIYVHGKP